MRSKSVLAALAALIAVVVPASASADVDYLPAMPPASGFFGHVAAVPSSFSSGYHVDLWGYPSGRENPYSYTMPSPMGTTAGDALDYNWVWVNGIYNYIVWSFEGYPADGVRVYPSQDHGPYPTEFDEYDVAGSDDQINWEQGQQVSLYTGSFQDCGYWVGDGCVHTHDGVKDFRFTRQYKFVWVRSIYDGDFEIDAVEALVPRIIHVDIDIKPGSYPNAVNTDGTGVIPVAVLGSATLDVNTIDPATVALESMPVKVVGKSSDRLLYSYEDVNGDGILDLVLQIADQDNIFAPGDSTATLTGKLRDGRAFEGSDSIQVVH